MTKVLKYPARKDDHKKKLENNIKNIKRVIRRRSTTRRSIFQGEKET